MNLVPFPRSCFYYNLPTNCYSKTRFRKNGVHWCEPRVRYTKIPPSESYLGRRRFPSARRHVL